MSSSSQVSYGVGSEDPERHVDHTKHTTISRKRHGEDSATTTTTIFKRVKGPFKAAYLNLLNEDILDAASGVLAEEQDELGLGYTQVGTVQWDPLEKQALYSALKRLGRDNIAVIASRIGTKSELEVQQYLVLLEEVDRQRRIDDGKRKRIVLPEEIPAAVELTQECTIALEAAADSLALRQEKHEESVEEKRWGRRWLIDASLAQVFERQYQQDELTTKDLPFIELLLIRNWVKLADNVFMNSAVPDGNWRSFSEETPAIQATTLADFYGLAISITKRLLLTTIYVAESRIRAKNSYDSRNRSRRLIKPLDVKAAIRSVGMKDNSCEFWSRCARRLRLDIVDDMDEENPDPATAKDVTNSREEEERGDAEIEADTQADEIIESDEPSIMSYVNVEAALGIQHYVDQGYSQPTSATDTLDTQTSSDEEISDAMEDEDSDMEDPGQPSYIEISDVDDQVLDNALIDTDLHEAVSYSAIGLEYGGNSRGKQALRSRIRAEHLNELDAEKADAQASARAESEIWTMLRGEDSKAGRPQEDKTDTTDETRFQRRRRAGLDDNASNWRRNFRYKSEWETLASTD
ncbi:hypothetical protein F5Y15DRAFT_366990 [Xylariaceae sp. FL0016]|nr:hypothetical protein F5Y15DRAFT_366990 [Xylariaceae sp. FL0016]